MSRLFYIAFLLFVCCVTLGKNSDLYRTLAFPPISVIVQGQMGAARHSGPNYLNLIDTVGNKLDLFMVAWGNNGLYGIKGVSQL